MKVAVFCSSAEDVSPFLLAAAEDLGVELAKRGATVIYGGANTGCMGRLARGVQAGMGPLVGVIPQMDFMAGIVQEGLTEQHIVPTLSSRKVTMYELADAFVVFPGGVGTLDEAFEVLAVQSVPGVQRKPVVMYNVFDIWTPLLEGLELLAQQRLIREPLHNAFVVLDKVERVGEHLIQNVRRS